MFSKNTMFSAGAAGFLRVSTGFLWVSTGFLRVFCGFSAVSRQDPAPFAKKLKIDKNNLKSVTSSCFAPKKAFGFQHPLQTGSV